MSTIGWRETIENSALTKIERATVEGKLSRSSEEAADLQQKVAIYGSNHSDQHERAAFVRGLCNPTPTSAEGKGTADSIEAVKEQVHREFRELVHSAGMVVASYASPSKLYEQREVPSLSRPKWEPLSQSGSSAVPVNRPNWFTQDYLNTAKAIKGWKFKENTLLHPLFTLLARHINGTSLKPGAAKNLTEARLAAVADMKTAHPVSSSLSIVHTHTSAYLSGMSPDFTLVEVGFNAVAVTAVALIELCQDIDTPHRGRVLHYHETLFTLQPTRSMIYSLITDMNQVEVIYSTVTSSTPLVVKHERLTGRSLFEDAGWNLLVNFFRSSTIRDTMRLPQFQFGEHQLTPSRALGFGATSVVWECTLPSNKTSVAVKQFADDARNISVRSPPAAVKAALNVEKKWLELLANDILPLTLLGTAQLVPSASTSASAASSSDSSSGVVALVMTPVGFLPRPDTSTALVRQMLSLVMAISKQGCVHRDLSTRHFLMDDSNRLFVFDFGFAVSHGDEVSFAGSSYFAPLSILESFHLDTPFVWLVTHNLESAFRVVYSALHPGFRSRLKAIDPEKGDLILAQWQVEQRNMGTMWKEIFGRISSKVFHDPLQPLIEAVNRCQLECIALLSQLERLLPYNITASDSSAPVTAGSRTASSKSAGKRKAPSNDLREANPCELLLRKEGLTIVPQGGDYLGDCLYKAVIFQARRLNLKLPRVSAPMLNGDLAPLLLHLRKKTTVECLTHIHSICVGLRMNVDAVREMITAHEKLGHWNDALGDEIPVFLAETLELTFVIYHADANYPEDVIQFSNSAISQQHPERVCHLIKMGQHYEPLIGKR